MPKQNRRCIRDVKEARIFAMFLLMERSRHLDDVDKIDKDLEDLKTKWGIDAWELPDTDWIDV